MLRNLLIINIMLICCSLNAHNSFIYLRFDESTNNVYSIRQKIQELLNSSDDAVLFYEHQSYDDNKLSQLLDSRDFLSNISVYEPYIETQELCATMEEMLRETTCQNDNKLCITGLNDTNWKLYFIIPESAGRKELVRWLDINGLLSRSIILHFITYNQYTDLKMYSFSQFTENIDDLLLLNF